MELDTFIEKDFITLIKVEVLKFILITKNSSIQNLLLQKKQLESITKNINFFLKLGFDIQEKEILQENIHNKYFNYSKIINNKILNFVLKNFEDCYSEIKNEEYQIKTSYFSFLSNLRNIKNTSNMIFNNNIINIEIFFNRFIDLYEIIYSQNLNIFLNQYCFFDNTIFLFNEKSKKKIIEKKKEYKTAIYIKKQINIDKNIFDNINMLREDMNTLNEYVIKYAENINSESINQEDINQEDINNENIKLINKIKFLEEKFYK